MDRNTHRYSRNEYAEIYAAITSGNEALKHQALANLAYLKFTDGSKMKRGSLYNGLTAVRSDTTLLHISVENGMAVPLLTLLCLRGLRILLAEINEGTSCKPILRSVVKGQNYHLFLFLMRLLEGEKTFIWDTLSAEKGIRLLHAIAVADKTPSTAVLEECTKIRNHLLIEMLSSDGFINISFTVAAFLNENYHDILWPLKFVGKTSWLENVVSTLTKTQRQTLFALQNDSTAETLLHCVVKNGDLEATQYILGNFDSPSDSFKLLKVTDSEGNTALHLASKIK